jgi:hypothetical protein
MKGRHHMGNLDAEGVLWKLILNKCRMDWTELTYVAGFHKYGNKRWGTR